MEPLEQQYIETTKYLFEQLPLFSKYGKSAINNSLDKITAFCSLLNHPEQQFKSIHIAGTNGKGSTSHMLSAILQRAGYKVGLYTSPHILDFRERILINGTPVSKQWVIDFKEKHTETFLELEPSFFEATVAMAFQYFAEQEVDIAIIETGLGGRLDSTNIITPILSIITNISYDHTDLLGNTLAKIANEKAGIIKEGIPFIIGEKHKETEQVFFEHAIHKKCSSFYADAQWGIVRVKKDEQFQYLKAIHLASHEIFEIKLDLLGNYQIHNLKTVLTAVQLLTTLNFVIPLNIAIEALAQVKKLSILRGRWEHFSTTPNIFIDVAHNKGGLQEVIEQWAQVTAPKKHIVLGFVKDKDIEGALDLFSPEYHYYFCNAAIPRALDAEALFQIATLRGLNGTHHASVAAAVQAAQAHMGADDALLITGSFFVVGEALAFLEHHQ